MKQEIMAWLMNPDATAEEGKQLYVKYGKNLFFMRILSSTNDPVTIKKALNNEFRLLIGINPLAKLIPKIIEEGLKVDSNRISVKNTRYSDPYNELTVPPELEGTYKLRNELYVIGKNASSSNTALGEVLRTIDENSEQGIQIVAQRCENAKLILDTALQLDKQWQIIHFFASNGRLPEPEALIPTSLINCEITDPLQLDKRYRNLKTYISKFRKDVEKNKEDLIKWANELNAICAIFSLQFDDMSHLPVSLESFSTIRK